MWTRREFLRTGAAAAALPLLGDRSSAADAAVAGCTLSIGTYSMKGMSIEQAIETIAAIGYDGIEISTQPPFDGEPIKVPPQRRSSIKRVLKEKNLALTALMEQVSPAADDRQNQKDLERLAHVAQLAADLAGDRPPVLQTVLGGGKWEDKKNLLRDRVGQWAEVFAKAKIVLAIKPHRGGALSRPDEAIWIFNQLKNPPYLRMVYDYSHYAFRDMSVEDTVRQALPYTAHIAVKDAAQKGEKVVFELAGASGTFDYVKLLRLFYQGGYRGDVCCEVSSMISNKPGYDPVAAAKTCYKNMARAFEEANVPRRKS